MRIMIAIIMAGIVGKSPRNYYTVRPCYVVDSIHRGILIPDNGRGTVSALRRFLLWRRPRTACSRAGWEGRPGAGADHVCRQSQLRGQRLARFCSPRHRRRGVSAPDAR
ncbi:hypothetical protein J3459_014722 [Metarhizium acridum]|uniref:uncharacterized protein n=1 Tax=Metarhizium acridum TaxID=92637 RepID=UPI001C6BABB3|nr:hypothetical protein J3458_014376 [Metarhizium acridum]KAG8414461.1 hypothetical protein J3459_014722 [Metarhizium acridum]